MAVIPSVRWSLEHNLCAGITAAGNAEDIDQYGAGWPTFRRPSGTLPQLRLPHPSRFSMGGKRGPQSNLGPRTFFALRRRTPAHVSDLQGLRFVPPTFRKPRKVGQPHLLRVSQHRAKVGQPHCYPTDSASGFAFRSIVLCGVTYFLSLVSWSPTDEPSIEAIF